jgi:hypothetical protein
MSSGNNSSIPRVINIFNNVYKKLKRMFRKNYKNVYKFCKEMLTKQNLQEKKRNIF